MKSVTLHAVSFLVAVAFLAGVPSSDAPAHGGGNWDPFTIDSVNDNARGRARDAQILMSEIILGRSGKDDWPLPALRTTRDQLITVKEEVDEVIEHYVLDGVNVQVAESLHADPRVGRSMAASGALNAAISLLDHAAGFESVDELVAEFYASGLAARLYELVEAHGDRMDLYATLTAAQE